MPLLLNKDIFDRELEKEEIEAWDPLLYRAYPNFINDDDEFDPSYMEQTTGDRIWYAGEIIRVTSRHVESGFIRANESRIDISLMDSGFYIFLLSNGSYHYVTRFQIER